MKFIKKYMFLITAILVVLLSAGLFVFGMRISAANRKEMENLASRCKAVYDLEKNLKYNNQIEYFESLAKERNMKADAMLAAISKVSRRPLLMSDYFPAPKYDMILSTERFAEAYVNYANALLTDMGAGDKPTKLEEDKVRQDYASSLVGAAATGAAYAPTYGMYSGTTGMAKTPADELVDALRQKRAESIKVYASTESLFGYSYWDSMRKKSDEDDKDTMLRRAWYTQLAAWIQKDVADSLLEGNAAATSVVNAPIKRLVEISFGGDALGGQTTTTSVSAGTAETVGRRVADSALRMPVYVLEPTAAAAATSGDGTTASATKTYYGQMTRSWTNRASDDFIDVVHFELSVIMDTTYIVDFVNILQNIKTSDDTPRNQITVLLIHTNPINLRQEEAAGYYYGGGSLAELRMICEYVFFHKGYESIMPEPVKLDLKPLDTSAAGGV